MMMSVTRILFSSALLTFLLGSHGGSEGGSPSRPVSQGVLRHRLLMAHLAQQSNRGGHRLPISNTFGRWRSQTGGPQLGKSRHYNPFLQLKSRRTSDISDLPAECDKLADEMSGLLTQVFQLFNDPICKMTENKCKKNIQDLRWWLKRDAFRLLMNAVLDIFGTTDKSGKDWKKDIDTLKIGLLMMWEMCIKQNTDTEGFCSATVVADVEKHFTPCVRSDFVRMVNSAMGKVIKNVITAEGCKKVTDYAADKSVWQQMLLDTVKNCPK